jgi:hypothetical protein
MTLLWSVGIIFVLTVRLLTSEPGRFSCSEMSARNRAWRAWRRRKKSLPEKVFSNLGQRGAASRILNPSKRTVSVPRGAGTALELRNVRDPRNDASRACRSPSLKSRLLRVDKLLAPTESDAVPARHGGQNRQVHSSNLLRIEVVR